MQGGEIKTHTSLTSPPPCFPGNFMETLKKFHQSFRTPKNAFWTPKKWFSAPTFHQKIEIWHQKRCFPTPNFLFPAPASRCTKNGQTQVCTSRAPPPPQSTKNWPNVLSQPGAWQYIYISLVGGDWNMNLMFPNSWDDDPISRTPSFFRGVGWNHQPENWFYIVA